MVCYHTEKTPRNKLGDKKISKYAKPGSFFSKYLAFLAAFSLTRLSAFIEFLKVDSICLWQFSEMAVKVSGPQ